MWRPEDPQGAESEKVKYDIVHYLRGRLLDVGCGPFKVFPYAIGVDDYSHAQMFGWQYKPDVISDASTLSMFANESMDSVFSSHALEHIRDTDKALKEWFRVLKKGGYLILYLPHKELYPNIGQPGANPDHKHDFLPEDITKAMKQVGCWDLVVNETRDMDFGQGAAHNEYSFLQIYKKCSTGQKESWNKPKPEKQAVVIRYGGIGDMIQAASVLPGLKKQGYHVTFNTTPDGMEILKNNPNIDEFLLQDKDQVPNEELGPFWSAMKRRFDKFVNLSESVETTLLRMPGSVVQLWPKEARHKVCNQNYLEVTHDIAEVPHEYAANFYSTTEEREWAVRERSKIGGKLIIAMSLAGSSVHKTWPYVDQVIARLLTTFPDCRVILLGNHMSKILETGWEKEPRVLKKSGVWGIRQTLTFVCKQADLVIGPETGVLNAVGLEDVAKICLLSHSTKENLTKHWKNTVALSPPETVACYPCHLMHYDWKNCNPVTTPEPFGEVAIGTALCQASIPADVVWAAILGIFKKNGTLDRVPIAVGG
jgi:ADP-heptose:LPS heptosyltransferase/predicted SAM-dependent methyltransferase